MAILDITNIPAPRVPFVDERTGLISREWYRFLLNLFMLSGGGQNNTSINDLLVGPPVQNLGEIDVQSLELAGYGAGASLEGQIAEIKKQLQELALTWQPADLSEVWSQLQSLQVIPPVTKTADFTVAAGETWLINNKSGSTCTVTLPAAGSFTGRSLTFKNTQAQLLVSASSNVAPIDSATPGTGILLAVAGNWATMISDGTNWVIMQQAPNNVLLLE